MTQATETGAIPPVALAGVREFLLAKSEADANAAWGVAEASLATSFPADAWAIGRLVQPFGDKAALFRNEVPPDLRRALINVGLDEDQYAAQLYDIQFNSVDIALRRVFRGGTPTSNRGWRLRLIGYPNLSTIVAGIGSNYQGTPSQNKHGSASRLIREIALRQLAGTDLAEIAAAYPSATASHWDERGLMHEPVHTVGLLDLTDLAPEGLPLRVARNTTVKKDLATFFFICGMPADRFAAEAPAQVGNLRAIAVGLARGDVS